MRSPYGRRAGPGVTRDNAGGGIMGDGVAWAFGFFRSMVVPVVQYVGGMENDHIMQIFRFG